jgi:hypothetical protein
MENVPLLSVVVACVEFFMETVTPCSGSLSTDDNTVPVMCICENADWRLVMMEMRKNIFFMHYFFLSLGFGRLWL